MVPSAWAGVLYVSGLPAETASPSLRSVQLDPPSVEYCTSKYIVELFAVRTIVDVALPLEQDPNPVTTVPLGQSEVLIVMVLNVVVPEAGDLLSVEVFSAYQLTTTVVPLACAGIERSVFWAPAFTFVPPPLRATDPPPFSV